MAKAREVMELLIPTGGWTIYGDDFDSIIYNEGVTPITEKQFDDGFAQVDAFKAEQEAKAEADKAALLAKLGITADEAKLLLS